MRTYEAYTVTLAPLTCPTCGAMMPLVSELSGDFSSDRDEWTAKLYRCPDCDAEVEHIWLDAPVGEFLEEITPGTPPAESADMPGDYVDTRSRVGYKGKRG